MDVFDLVAKITLDTKEYDSALSGAGDRLSGFGSAISGGLGTIAKVGAAAITAASGAVVTFGKSAVDAGKEFDRAMGQVQATAGLSAEEMEGQVGSVETSFGHFEGTLRDFAQFMGANTAFSATQAAQALNYMALAGYDAQKSMDMLPAVLNMAAAGSMDLADASDMITDTQSALGLTFERTSQMVDEFAKAASTGNTSVSQLGEAFLRVGGLAKETNGGFVTLADGTQVAVDNVQEMEIAFTAMANAGVKGAEAGTHMRNMIMKLSSPTDKGAAALENLGVSVFDAEGNMRSLIDIFSDLQTGLESVTQAEKLDAISEIFNARDLASAEALLGAVNQDWNAIGESILQAEGAATEMAGTQLDNLAGDTTIFKSALEGAQIALSDQLMPYLREFVQMGTSGLSQITQAFKEGGLEGAFGALGDWLAESAGKLTEYIPSIVDAGVQLLEGLGQGLIDNQDVILNAIDKVVKTILGEFAKGGEGGEEDKSVSTFLSGLVKIFTDNLPQLITIGAGMITTILGALLDNADEMVSGAKDILETLMSGITEYLPEITDSIVDIIVFIVQTLSENTEQLVESAILIINTVATALIDNLPVLIPAIIDIILGIVGALTSPDSIKMLIDAAVKIIGGLVAGIAKSVDDVLGAIGTLIGNIVMGIIYAVPKLVEAGGRLIAGLIVGIVNGIKGIGEAIVNLCKALVDSFKTFFGIHSPSKVFEDLGKNLIDGLIEGVKGMISKVGDTIGEIGTKIKDTFSGLFTTAKEWGGDLIDNFTGGIESGIGKVGEVVGKVGQKIKDLIGFSEPKEGVLSDFHTYAPDMMKLFASGVEQNEKMLQDQVSQAFDFSDMVTSPEMDMSKGMSAIKGSTAGVNATQNAPQNVTVVLEIDKTQFAHTVFTLNGEESQRVGVNLAY